MGFGAGVGCKSLYSPCHAIQNTSPIDVILACVGINLAQMELRCATTHFFRRWPQASVSSREGMSDGDMGQEAWVFMSPSGRRCLIELRS